MITMGTFLVFLGGILFLAGIIFLMIPYAGKGKTWKTITNWVLYFIVFLDLSVGISFIYINSLVGHAKATSTALFLFIGSAIVFAIIWARLMGFLGGNRNKVVKEGLSNE